MKKGYFCLLMLVASNACAMNAGKKGIFTRFDMANMGGLGDLVPRDQDEDSCVRASEVKKNREKLGGSPVNQSLLARALAVTREARAQKDSEARFDDRKEGSEELVMKRRYVLDPIQVLIGLPYSRNVVLNDEGTILAAGSHAINDDKACRVTGPSSLRVWRFNKELGIFTRSQTLDANGSCTYSLDVSSGDHRIATAGWDGAMKVYRDDNGQYTHLQTHQTSTSAQRALVALAFSPEGHMLASSSLDKRVYFLKREGEKYTPTETSLKFEHRVDAMAFRSEKTLALGMSDGTLQFCVEESGVFNPADRIGQQESNPGNGVNSIAFHSLNNMLAIGSDDATIRLFKVNEKGRYEHLQTLVGHEKPVTALDFDNAAQLISGSGDGSVCVWDQNKEGMYALMDQTPVSNVTKNDPIVAAIRCVPHEDPIIVRLEKVKGALLVSRLRATMQTVSAPRIQEEETKDDSGSSSPVAINIITDEAVDSGSSVASE